MIKYRPMYLYEKLIAEIKELLPVYSWLLNPGASQQHVDEFLRSTKLEIPVGFIDFYAVCDGAKPYEVADIGGMCFYSLEGIIKAKEMFDEILDEKTEERKYFCWHKDWLPIANDFSYDTLAIDTTGKGTGKKGCVLERSKDLFEGDTIGIIAPDFNTYIQDWASRVKQGQVYSLTEKTVDGMNERIYDDANDLTCINRVHLKL